MAYWTVDFRTIDNNLINIQIDGVQGDSDIPLIPSDSPLYLEEEGKEDLFIPCKTQSGYVEIITDSFSLIHDILPTAGGTRTVVVRKDNVVIFKGYVQPKIITFKLWRGKQKLQIPIECRLSALKYKSDSLFQLQKASIYEILGSLLDFQGNEFRFAFFQGRMVTEHGSTDAGVINRAWLRKRIYTGALFDSNMTHLEMLEALCVFFGWSCRTNGNDVYFIRFRNVDIDYRQLQYISISNLKSGDFSIPRGIVFFEREITPSDIRGNDTTIKYIEGVRNADASCEIETFDLQISFPDEDVKEAINDGSISSIKTEGSTELPNWRKREWLYFTDSPAQGYTIDNEWEISNWNNVEVVLDKKDSLDVKDWVYSLKVQTTYDITYVREFDPDYAAAWWEIETIHHTYNGILQFKTRNVKTFSANGILTLNVNIEKIDMTTRTYFIRVMIGNLYYYPNTATWSQTFDDNLTRIPINDNDKQCTIQVSAGLSGYITVDFLPDFNMQGFGIEYTATENNDINSNMTNVSFNAHNDAFSKDMDFSSQICLKENYMRASKNILLNMDDSECTGLYETPTIQAPFNPLQNLVDGVVAETASQHTCIKLPIKNDSFSSMPISLYYIEDLNEFYYPASFQLEARDGLMKVMLVRRNYEG